MSDVPNVPGLVPGAYVIVRHPSIPGGVSVRIEQVTPFGLWARHDQRRWNLSHPDQPARSSPLTFFPFALSHVSIWDELDPPREDRETISVSAGPGGIQVRRR
jgi:hypothetical protein